MWARLSNLSYDDGYSFSFRSLPEAQCAISRIHQMEVMGYRLSAELSNKTFHDQEPQGKCDSFRDKETQYLTLLKRLHLDQSTPPGLKYKYPHPTLHVLLNIISALCEHKRFYTQAFITLQTVDQAKLALQETNGYILKDKPMVVQYARSIQAKPAP
ncbi:uncharacterized protein LOC103513226 [Diaphorina citri]|uniref:Uncharacterized protein LOC103513226 n=1 Tax=Diaphorina citri TaxID=121845 RepID=A0A3Q0J1G8_DIACI|nr:uncharacterized protein LOC103513226 [Diaphorina citri]